MRKRTFLPSPRLSELVRSFDVIETTTEEMTRTVLPDTGLIVGLRYAGSVTSLDADAPQASPRSAIVGLRTTARCLRTSVGGGMILARFRAAHSGRFFGESIHELFGETLPLDQVTRPADVARASARLEEARSDAERIAIFEELLLTVRRPWEPDPIVLRALRSIFETSGSLRIHELARATALSQDALEKRFRRAVGGTPKQFASIVRLRRAVDAYRGGRSLTRVALDSGYCDQSHFIRHFRQATGQAPREFLALNQYC